MICAHSLDKAVLTAKAHATITHDRLSQKPFLRGAALDVGQHDAAVVCQPSHICLGRFEGPQAMFARNISVCRIPTILCRYQGSFLKDDVARCVLTQCINTATLERNECRLIDGNFDKEL